MASEGFQKDFIIYNPDRYNSVIVTGSWCNWSEYVVTQEAKYDKVSKRPGLSRNSSRSQDRASAHQDPWPLLDRNGRESASAALACLLSKLVSPVMHAGGRLAESGRSQAQKLMIGADLALCRRSLTTNKYNTRSVYQEPVLLSNPVMAPPKRSKETGGRVQVDDAQADGILLQTVHHQWELADGSRRQDRNR